MSSRVSRPYGNTVRRMETLRGLTQGLPFALENLPADAYRRVGCDSVKHFHRTVNEQARRGFFVINGSRDPVGREVFTWLGTGVVVIAKQTDTEHFRLPDDSAVFRLTTMNDIDRFLDSLSDDEKAAMSLLKEDHDSLFDEHGRFAPLVANLLFEDPDDLNSFVENMKECGILLPVGPNENCPLKQVWEWNEREFDRIIARKNDRGSDSDNPSDPPPPPSQTLEEQLAQSEKDLSEAEAKTLVLRSELSTIVSEDNELRETERFIATRRAEINNDVATIGPIVKHWDDIATVAKDRVMTLKKQIQDDMDASDARVHDVAKVVGMLTENELQKLMKLFGQQFK